MKKVLSVLLVIAIAVSLCACGGGKTKKAFEASKEAYKNVNAAYEITEKFGSDIYEAWRLGIYEKDEVLDDGCAALAKELNLSENEIATGAAYAVIEILGEDWKTVSDSDKQKYINNADSLFNAMEDDLFSWCVNVVSCAYIANGKVAEAQGYLDEAKGQMKDLSNNYSDYEHYPALKGYYTTTASFFDFCQNPTGSFEQVKTTLENYKTTARDYNADLNYIFEE